MPILPLTAIIRDIMEMRLRLPELLKDAELTPYAAAKASGGRLDVSTLYRLVRKDGRVKYFAADMMEALCDVLNVSPGDLLERDHKRKR